MKQTSRLKKLRNRCFIKIVAVLLVITAIIVVSWLYFRTVPAPIPRDVRILIGGDVSAKNILLNIHGNSFEAITFIGIYDWDSGYSRWGLSYDNEMLDKAIFDDFLETRTWKSILNVPIRIDDTTRDYRFPVLERWTTELSANQLRDIWLLIDDVVNNYKEPLRFEGRTGQFRHANALIDGSLYRGDYLNNESFLSKNFRFSRRERKYLEDFTDISLLKLTHYLTDLLPEELWW